MFSAKDDRETRELVGFKTSWNALQVFNLYRLILIFVVLGFYALSLRQTAEVSANQALFLGAASVYLLFSLGCFISTYWHKPAMSYQVTVQVCFDIFFITLLMHSGIGLRTAYGIMINAAIAGGSILTAGRISLWLASVATMVVLLEHYVLHGLILKGYVQVGLLGATFFATAVLGYGLSRRIRESEALANQAASNIDRLQRLNQHIVRQLHSGVVVLDEEHRIRLINEYAKQLLGIPTEKENGLVVEVNKPLADELAKWEARRHHHPIALPAAAMSPPIMVRFNPLDDEETGSILVYLEDTTKLAEQAQQLKLASLGCLTASIAHEIRNPMGAISHAVQLLGEGKSREPTRSKQRLVEIIITNTDRINTVIKNVLDLSRRDSMVPSEIGVKSWLTAFAEELMARFSDDNLEVTIDVKPEDLTVFIDKDQLQQALFNLCENGVRHSLEHTSRPRLALSAYLQGSDSLVILDVVDNGPGVALASIPRIFEPFFTTHKGGTGLGLYLAKELCEANRAHLSYICRSEGGGCFRISFRDAGVEYGIANSVNR